MTDEYVLEVLPNGNMETGEEFQIELVATSTSLYEKIIKATVIIKTNIIENYIVNLTDSSNANYSILNIKVNEPNEDLTVKYDSSKLILDKASYLINNLTVTEGTLNSFTIPKENLEKGSNYEIYFVKLQDEIVLGTDIIV